MSRYDAISEAVVILSVVGFFTLALVIGFGANASEFVRDGLAAHPIAANLLPAMRTTTVGPTPTVPVPSPPPNTLFQIGTPVPILATVNAILTSHALRIQNPTPPPTTPELSIQSTASPTADQSVPTSEVTGPATETPTVASLTSIESASETPPVASPTTSAPATDTPRRAFPTARRAPTRTPKSGPTAIQTPVPSITAPVLGGSSPVSGAIVLSWSEAGQLGPDDYFDVRVWQDGQPATGIVNVQQPSFTIGGSFPGGTYNWTIAVIRKQGGQVVTLAEAATVLRFTWAPASSGGVIPPRR